MDLGRQLKRLLHWVQQDNGLAVAVAMQTVRDARIWDVFCRQESWQFLVV